MAMQRCVTSHTDQASRGLLAETCQIHRCATLTTLLVIEYHTSERQVTIVYAELKDKSVQ